MILNRNSFIGSSNAMVQIRRTIEKLAPSRDPVLLLGESGTGKEVVARALYDANPAGTFVPIDCGSLVGPLMESELFGHARGAFTGASEAKRGLIEAAHGGTAFFDEIGDLPLEMQVKLLRVLQEREYRPVGSLTRHKVDIRVIAATHRNLAREVERGAFRQDLYYRLNVISVRLPALRDRKEDIPALVESFLDRSNNHYSLTRETLHALLGYDWPGNVRELQNCIARMAAMNSGPLLHTADLPSALQNSMIAGRAGQASIAAAATFDGGPPVRPGVVPLHEIEKRAIIEALERTKGDRGVAAHLLGIGRTTLYRKLKEYKLET
ncbi:MAG: sigma-54 dependent transcriptional regulator [Acidobacteriota bacterium]|nr:sigma-54 dependent transcriptional regulator [Acidobacteriota bacterium]